MIFTHTLLPTGCFIGTWTMIVLVALKESLRYGTIFQHQITTKHYKMSPVVYDIYIIFGVNGSAVVGVGWMEWDGHFKNSYVLVNHGARKFSFMNSLHIFQCKGCIFCVEFLRGPLKFHTKYLSNTLKLRQDFYSESKIENLEALILRTRKRAVMYVWIANPRWLGKRSRHSRRMCKTQF